MNEGRRVGGAAEDLAALLARCACGDHAAFEAVYRSQSPRLYGLALQMLRQPALAADAVHDAFMQVWRRSARFDPSRGHAEAWLTALLRYRAIDTLRRRGRETYGHVPEEVADTEPDALAALSGEADAAALRRCLQELEEPQQQAVRLAFLEGLSHAELAERLDAPLGTVKSWVRRALIGLRRCLQA